MKSYLIIIDKASVNETFCSFFMFLFKKIYMHVCVCVCVKLNCVCKWKYLPVQI